MSVLPFVLALPWLGLVLFEILVVRFPSELPPSASVEVETPAADAETPAADVETPDAEVKPSDPAPGGSGPPFVSVIVPARNEALDIVECLLSLTASTYPSFEVIVVDDRSDDGTGELARALPRGKADRLEVIDGRPLPEGWLGKPWACHQGSRVATGDLLLFTDADTIHGPDLLGRAVTGWREEGADLLTVVGRQIMGSFWERVVQPHVFFLMLLRFPDFETVAKNENWRDAIANGQFLLFTREAYAAIDGHRSVKDEVVEDLALAQVLKRAGLELRIRSADESLATRMYRSLAEIVEGWSKNMLMGGLQSVPKELRTILPPVSFVGELVLWLLAPGVLLAGAVGLVDPGTIVGQASLVWAATVVGLCLALWARWYHRMGAGWWYAACYPLGAAVFAYIFLRSWTRGRDVEWKGRRYRLRSVQERP